MSRSIRSIVLAVALLACACSTTSPSEPQVSASLDESFVLRAGQEAAFASDPLRLRFEAVLEDSRCAVDVVCIWAGNARVEVRLSGDAGAERRLELNTGVEPRSGSALGYRVELVRLAPQPRQGREIRREDYTAELRVVRDP